MKQDISLGLSLILLILTHRMDKIDMDQSAFVGIFTGFLFAIAELIMLYSEITERTHKLVSVDSITRQLKQNAAGIVLLFSFHAFLYSFIKWITDVKDIPITTQTIGIILGIFLCTPLLIYYHSHTLKTVVS